MAYLGFNCKKNQQLYNIKELWVTIYNIYLKNTLHINTEGRMNIRMKGWIYEWSKEWFQKILKISNFKYIYVYTAAKIWKF